MSATRSAAPRTPSERPVGFPKPDGSCYANGQRLATRVDGSLYYVHSDHHGSTVALSDAAGGEVGRVQYDPYGEVLTSTLPVTLTEQLLSSQGLDSRLGLVYHGDGRYYDPAIAHTLQPDPFGGVPQLPQSLNRYAVPSGASVVGQVSPGLHPLLVTGSGAVVQETISASVGSALGRYVQRLGRFHVTANLAVMRRAGYIDFFQRLAAPGRGRSTQFVSPLLREVDEGIYEVLEGAWQGRRIVGETLEEALESAVVSNRWPVRGLGFTAIDDTALKAFIRSGLGDFSIGFATDLILAIPELAAPWSDPYLYPWQRGVQTLERGLGVAVGSAVTFAVAASGGSLLIIIAAGTGVAFVWNWAVPPIVTAVSQYLGVPDPYQRERRLRPLE